MTAWLTVVAGFRLASASAVTSGFKTELKVRFLDGEPAPAAFDAVAVIDDLGPLYYES